MDDVEKLLNEIKEDESVVKTRFSANFLDSVSEIYEKHGFGATKAFLLDKQQRRELKKQATALLNVLNKFEKYPRVKDDRRIGRIIIKILGTLTSQRRR